MKLFIPFTVFLLSLNSFSSFNITESEKYPYVAKIIINNSNICTGSLVSPRLVLTAAHCVKKTKTTSN